MKTFRISIFKIRISNLSHEREINSGRRNYGFRVIQFLNAGNRLAHNRWIELTSLFNSETLEIGNSKSEIQKEALLCSSLSHYSVQLSITPLVPSHLN